MKTKLQIELERISKLFEVFEDSENCVHDKESIEQEIKDYYKEK